MISTPDTVGIWQGLIENINFYSFSVNEVLLKVILLEISCSIEERYESKRCLMRWCSFRVKWSRNKGEVCHFSALLLHQACRWEKNLEQTIDKAENQSFNFKTVLLRFKLRYTWGGLKRRLSVIWGLNFQWKTFNCSFVKFICLMRFWWNNTCRKCISAVIHKTFSNRILIIEKIKSILPNKKRKIYRFCYCNCWILQNRLSFGPYLDQLERGTSSS